MSFTGLSDHLYPSGDKHSIPLSLLRRDDITLFVFYSNMGWEKLSNQSLSQFALWSAEKTDTNNFIGPKTDRHDVTLYKFPCAL